MDDSTGGTDRTGAMADALTAVVSATLQMALGLMLVAAGSDLLFAILERDGPLTLSEGALLVALAVAGLRYPRPAARILARQGALTAIAALFAAGGVLDWGLQLHYSEVAPAIVGVAVVLCQPRWVLATLLVSILGYLAALAALGHPPAWMLHGHGLNLLVNQMVDLVAYAGVLVLLVLLVRRFLMGVPVLLAEARQGNGLLTPALTAAVQGGPVGLLDRGDPVANAARLSNGERQLLALLADGLAPKQAALALHLSLPGVRSRIASAKRKTGARTLDQLVALYAEGSHGL